MTTTDLDGKTAVVTWRQPRHRAVTVAMARNGDDVI